MRHIYIHVPFCARRCVYCDFAVAVRKQIPADRYVSAIFREHEHRKAVGEWDGAPLATLYLGGGTPSLLPSQRITTLVRHFLAAEGAAGPALEVTIEANPEDVSESNAHAWKTAGVNRASLGVQSFDPRVLRWMHRTHTAEQAERAARTLREAGFESISLDLIAALPPQLDRNFSEDLSRALELEPDHISVYGLTVEPRTALARWAARGVVSPATDLAYSREFLLAHDTLVARGYEHYEVSNYAREGQQSRHNRAYWDGGPYAGLGPSAHGFDGAERRWNVGPWAKYEDLVNASGDPTGGRETLTPDQAALERAYLGLRLSEGLSLEETRAFAATVLAEAEARGWGTAVAGRWRLTAAGWLRLDELVAALSTSPEGG